MRKVILNLAITLDDFIEGPNGEIDWLVKDKDVDFGDILTDLLADIDAIFYGRISYDKWGNYHPGENASQKLKEAYDLLHSKTKYVFSTTKTNDAGKTIFINSNIKERVLEIVQQPGKNIWLYGGGKLITTFINLGLVNVYKLAVHPVIIGSGKPVFKDIQQKIGLELIDTKTSKSGVVLLNYAANTNKTSHR